MSVYRTSKGRPASHCHLGHQTDTCACCGLVDFTHAEVQQKRAYMAAHFPDAVEIHVPTRKYNCHGYTFANSHGWFCDPDIFLADDFREVDMNSPKVNDVVIYRDEDQQITHSGIVNEVLDGMIQTLRSKFGYLAAVIHPPDKVDPSWGSPAQLFRRPRSRRRTARRK